MDGGGIAVPLCRVGFIREFDRETGTYKAGRDHQFVPRAMELIGDTEGFEQPLPWLRVVGENEKIPGNREKVQNRHRREDAAVCPGFMTRLRLRLHSLPPDVQRVSGIGPECRSHLAQKIDFKEIEERPAAAPMKRPFATHDETVLGVACDQRWSVKAIVSIMARPRRRALIEGLSDALGHRVPILDRHVGAVRGIRPMAVLEALSASTRAPLVPRRHGTKLDDSDR
jgi:hypothetical protein